MLTIVDASLKGKRVENMIFKAFSVVGIKVEYHAECYI